MFNFSKFTFKHHHPKKRECGLIIFAIGIGILLGVILPLWGWMIGCAFGLIIVGFCEWKDC